jgi:hypothetical protein
VMKASIAVVAITTLATGRPDGPGLELPDAGGINRNYFKVRRQIYAEITEKQSAKTGAPGSVNSAA